MILGVKIQIPADADNTTTGEALEGGYYTKSKQEKISRVQKLYNDGLTCSEISKQLKIDIRAVKRYIDIDKDSNEFKDKDTAQIRHEAAVLKKEANIANVRELHEQGYSLRAISKMSGLSRQTVTKYLDKNVSPVHGLYGTQIGGPLTPFHEDIDTLLDKGWTIKNIETAMREKGYTGSASAIRMYTTEKRRLMKQILKIESPNTEIVERQSLIQLLYKPINKIKKLTQEQFNKVIELHSIISYVGFIFGLLNMTTWFALQIDNWWMSVLHLPLVILSSYGLFTANREKFFDYKNLLLSSKMHSRSPH